MRQGVTLLFNRPIGFGLPCCHAVKFVRGMLAQTSRSDCATFSRAKASPQGRQCANLVNRPNHAAVHPLFEGRDSLPGLSTSLPSKPSVPPRPPTGSNGLGVLSSPAC